MLCSWAGESLGEAGRVSASRSLALPGDGSGQEFGESVWQSCDKSLLCHMRLRIYFIEKSPRLRTDGWLSTVLHSLFLFHEMKPGPLPSCSYQPMK